MIDELVSETWKKIIVKEIISLTYSEIKNYLKKYNRKVISSNDNFNEAFKLILTDIFNWAGYIQSIGLYGSNNDLLKHYIELDFYLVPARYQYKELAPTSNLVHKLSNDREKNIVVFGLPGMGKTTSMKMIAYKIITDEYFLPNYLSIPIVIRFRELKDYFNEREYKENANKLLYLYIFKLFNLKFSVEDEDVDDGIDYHTLVRQIVYKTLDDLKIVLILDGFDELEHETRNNIFVQVREVAFKTVHTKIILTSRTGEFNYNIENFNYYELAPLSNQQIRLFSQKWLGDEKYHTFISKLESSAFFDAAIRPLILSFLCIIYKYNDELPNKPKFIYREIIDLLLEKWDKERFIPRKSKFSNFNKNQKLDFISYLAFHLIIKSKYYFSKYDIQIVYGEIAEDFELNKFNYQEVIDEIEEHSGLFIQSGTDKYEFPHKSIQEFLAAEYLVKYSPISHFKGQARDIPNELAIVIALSTNPNEKLIEVLNLLDFSKKMETESFLETFLNRLTSELPVFRSNVNTAIKICKMIEHLKNLYSYDNYIFFNNLFKFKGISESFDLLDEQYTCEPNLVKSLMKGFMVDPNELIKIFKRDSSESLLLYFSFTHSWRYIRPYIKK